MIALAYADTLSKSTMSHTTTRHVQRTANTMRIYCKAKLKRNQSKIILNHMVLFIFVQTVLLIVLGFISTNCDASNSIPVKLSADPMILDTNSLYASTLAATNRASWLSQSRIKRSATSSAASNSLQAKFVDACQSKMEVVTPYYASNNKGKLRTIVNSELMQQAIQIETCLRSSNSVPSKCNLQPDCGCEQKYKWHRLLVMDPNEAYESGSTTSRGLFMDWFLFPSNCVCRCRTPPASSTKLFLKTAIGTQHQNGKLGTG